MNDDPTFVLEGTKYAFKPLSGPLEQDPSAKIFADLGYALAAWARMEHLLTCLVLHINKEDTNAILHEKDPQSKFSKLLKLFRKWLSKHPGYAHLTSEYDYRMYDGLLQQAQLRNELAHGFLTDYNEETGEFTMLQIKRIGVERWKVAEQSYSGRCLEIFSRLTNLAHRHFVEVAKNLFEEIPPPTS